MARRLRTLHPVPVRTRPPVPEQADESTGPPGEHSVGALQQQLDLLQETLNAVRSEACRSEAVAEGFGRLEKQVNRAGREQFKANAALDALREQVTAAVEQGRSADTYRERELQVAREGRAAAGVAARRELLERLLPVMDSLSEAVASGRRRIVAAERLPSRHFPWQAGPDAVTREALAGFRAWAEGIELVQERLAELLRAEGVEPIPTAGRPFDPNHHVAVEVAAAEPGQQPGVIVRELRRGYRIGDRVLRYAEVAVVRARGNQE